MASCPQLTFAGLGTDSIILETDPIAISSRVSRPRPDAGVNLSDITLNEQTIMQVCLALPASLRPSAPADLAFSIGSSARVLQAFSTVRDRIGQRILA